MNNPARLENYRRALDFAQQQVERLVDQSPDFFPIYTEQGRWHHAGELWTDWTGGFLAGMMWKFYGLTSDEHWRNRAEHYSRLLEHRQHDRQVHDLGFIFLNTYLPWFEVTGDRRLQEIVIQAGRTLSKRYREKGSYLASFIGPESLFIDIMMNVPLIFYAANESGDERLREIAVAHCRTTRDRLVRADGSTAHEGQFDLETGEFLGQTTHQGLAGDSVWARGLGWSLYGYSQVFARSDMPEFLEVSRRNANYWLKHCPSDFVPYWDFHADLSQPPPLGAQRESSAGAIAASGLLHLSEQVTRLTTITSDSQAYDHDGLGSGDEAASYRETALKTLDTLCSPDYLADQTPGWEGILKHGVYHTTKNLGVDESVMWGEFFFVEALTRALRSAENT
jgi:unsaturated chondroitin disaccharide hydrolase